MDARTSKSTYVSWADDCAVPVAHHDIVSILETIRAGAVSNTLLALLELLEQTKVTRDLCHVSKIDQHIERSIDAPLAMVEERQVTDRGKGTQTPVPDLPFL